MWTRRSLRLPILLAVGMIVLLSVLTVGWVLLALFGAASDDRYAALYWTLLPLGATFLGLLLAGVVIYLILSIKAINLTQRQSNFIDSVTHELKSPLASMKLYLQTLNRYPVPPEEQANFYRFMLDDLERLDRLINQMLDAARVSSGPRDNEREEVDLAALLQNCADSVCGSYHVPRESVELACDACTYFARRSHLELIFRNLIDNAVKYAGQPPKVEIALQASADGRRVVRISDNGAGIPRALRRKIFGRFVRVGSELERERPGTGLGLFIVRTLIDHLRGKITVRDARNGRGTTFEVYLPPVAIVRSETSNADGAA